VEQLVARWAHNPKAVGSSPTPATLDSQKSRLSHDDRDFLFDQRQQTRYNR
jgi:hypothetical protein